MTEKVQADDVQRRQPRVVRCCLNADDISSVAVNVLDGGDFTGETSGGVMLGQILFDSNRQSRQQEKLRSTGSII